MRALEQAPLTLAAILEDAGCGEAARVIAEGVHRRT